MSAQPQLVKQAMQAFRQGNYAAAKVLYQKAATQYGAHLFKANIYLCDKNIRSDKKLPILPINLLQQDQLSKEANNELKETQHQLQETQQLLEHYYQHCQALEYQLLDR